MDTLSLLRWDNILIYSFHHCHEGTKQTDITNEDLVITRCLCQLHAEVWVKALGINLFIRTFLMNLRHEEICL